MKTTRVAFERLMMFSSVKQLTTPREKDINNDLKVAAVAAQQSRKGYKTDQN